MAPASSGNTPPLPPDVKANPDLPQGQSENQGVAKWFTLDEVLRLRVFFAAEGAKPKECRPYRPEGLPAQIRAAANFKGDVGNPPNLYWAEVQIPVLRRQGRGWKPWDALRAIIIRFEANYRDSNRNPHIPGCEIFDITCAAFKKLLIGTWRRDDLVPKAVGANIFEGEKTALRKIHASDVPPSHGFALVKAMDAGPAMAEQIIDKLKQNTQADPAGDMTLLQRVIAPKKPGKPKKATVSERVSSRITLKARAGKTVLRGKGITPALLDGLPHGLETR
ncbi:hypothetical protein ROG8370_03799 [Roseovarius gaetbuli]|uniref:Uncharacterized protein n=1 Tax=Roseovarius gaetbuli TaxID=1356575 RepID=A0A1X7ABY0_9RHOB|nr:hypothetical protein [Roseovarius gaetbuli]SLN75584.1 hypothetical protein ROG8370_03799 [Roseovarius gaetbuli]